MHKRTLYYRCLEIKLLLQVIDVIMLVINRGAASRTAKAGLQTSSTAKDGRPKIIFN